jgi:hypothetical protein
MRFFKRERECPKRIPKCQRTQMASEDNFRVAGACGVIAMRPTSQYKGARETIPAIGKVS